MKKEVNKGGRPPKIDKEILAKLEQAFAMGCSDSEACVFADINLATLYRYQKQNPEFSDRKRLLKDKPVLKARSIVVNALNKNDKEVAKWYLERKRKDEFSLKVENDVTLSMTDEDINEVERILFRVN